jgi:hypothetical protein
MITVTLSTNAYEVATNGERTRTVRQRDRERERDRQTDRKETIIRERSSFPQVCTQYATETAYLFTGAQGLRELSVAVETADAVQLAEIVERRRVVERHGQVDKI